MGAKKSISNSFTVNTVEDGATLTAKSAIHSVSIRCTSDGKSGGSGSSVGMVTLYVDGVAVPTTYLSIKSQPSGLTVLTHTQQSAIPEGGVSISWANNVDMANLEGEVVLTVSYDSYSTEFSIPIICAKDGEDGTDGKTYALKLTVPSLVIPCDASGNSKASGNKDCYVTMYVDGTAVQTSAMTLTVISKPTSITVQTHADVSQISKNRLYITYSANVARSNLEGNILFSISDGTNTTYSSIAVVCANDGQHGKTGRFFYYGKEFNTSRIDTFSATDTEAPFFYYNSNYWLYKGENFSNKTITQIQNDYGAPANNNGNWEIMVSDFKYLITEAIFGNYAHFGSAIINGDWMISKWGTKNGVFSQDYTKFDPAYPNESVNTTHTVNGTTWTGYNFVPNYSVDLLKGISYQNRAVVRGTIVADNLYHGVCFFCEGDSSAYTDNFYSNNKYYCFNDEYVSDYGYDEGNYYDYDEIIPEARHDFDLHFMPCTYDADIVSMIPNSSNWADASGNYYKYKTVLLPDPKDFIGKIVEVSWTYSGNGASGNNPRVGCVVSNAFAEVLRFDDTSGTIQRQQAEELSYVLLTKDVTSRFVSVQIGSSSNPQYCWLKLDSPSQSA